MQVVIDIPEDIWEMFQKDTCCGLLDVMLYQLIKYGTPIDECEDAISRELVIKIIKDNLNNVYQFVEQYATEIWIAIENLPSVQPKIQETDREARRRRNAEQTAKQYIEME